ncbi:ubiquitin-like 1-activating enzyme E1 B [Fusarium beomiforme]|uniref:Ubiquitin-activating enzyme E1-like n=1 Tax=Fusarium beomiforme TaxID=44412 RepID=A0A9P5AK12_9HYPO|nr:ubiquitin-like 1-activating enzyme E1 B [Fusarium beomiforme]
MTMNATNTDQAPAQTQDAAAAPASAVASVSTQQPQTQTKQQQQQHNVSSEHAPQKRTPTMTRDRHNQQSLGASLNTSVKQNATRFDVQERYIQGWIARVLMVGAGGIGCELLKNLVLTGFGEIHIVDLDTIDLSNLNRQFLFRYEHIKKSKALVAKEAAQRFNPNVKIVAHHANIKDDGFTVAWFQQFRIAFNALDNLEARRHVNKMCLAADVPLIESGTTGFNGQVQVIKKGVTACYDCTPKEAPKSFPVCTIRSTPSQPIHCIVWGKSYLLNEIFGTSEDQAAFDHSTDADNAKEIEELKKESEALKKIRDATGTSKFPQMLFDKVFNADIERLRSVEGMWTSRRAPEPLQYETVLAQADEAFVNKDTILYDDQRVWSLNESLVVFNDSLDRLSKRILELKKKKAPEDPEPTITFDKDDIDTLDFVTASANIRSTIFGIDKKSRFDTKQMAGNIIPAIATTNAIVAGLCVLQSFKILKGEYAQSKEVFLTPFAPARLLAPDRSREPNPECPVCSVYFTSIVADLSRATLKHLVDDIVKSKLGFESKEFVVNNDIGTLVECFEDGDDENLPKKLGDLGIKKDSFLTIIDQDDEDTFVNVVINVQEGTLKEDEKPVKATFSENPKIPRRLKQPQPVGANGKGELNNEQTAIAEPKGVKRSHGEDGEPPLKKLKITDSETEVVDVDEVESQAGGAIIIDD